MVRQTSGNDAIDPSLRERGFGAAFLKVGTIYTYQSASTTLASPVTEDRLLKRWLAKVNGAANSTGISKN